MSGKKQEANETPKVNYEEIINGLEQQRDQLLQQLQVAQNNELILSRELHSYLIRERDMLRGALNDK